MARILYLSLTGMSEPLGESQVVQYLVCLAKNNIINLLSFEKTSDKEKIPLVKKKLDQANINWKYFEYSNRFGLFSSAAQICWSFLISIRWIKNENVKIIHARSLIPGLIALLIKKILKTKFIFDIRGFAIDEKIMDGRLKHNSITTKVLKKLEHAIYRNADHVVTLTHVSKPLIEKIYDINPKKITVIPTCANADLFTPLPLTETLAIKRKHGFNEDDIIILHNGSLNGSIDFDAEIMLYKKLIEINVNIKLLILNKGQHAEVKNYLKKYKIEKEKYQLLTAPLNEIYHYLNIADLCVFFIKPSFAKQASAPTKFAETIACHLYSLTNKHYGDMEFYFNSYNIGMLLDLDELRANLTKTAQTVIEFVKSRCKNKTSRSEDFVKLFSEHFSCDIAVKRYQAIYDSLIE